MDHAARMIWSRQPDEGDGNAVIKLIQEALTQLGKRSGEGR
jgi:hypothetical protein